MTRTLRALGAALDAWLDGVAHSTIVESTGGDGDPDTVYVDGDTPSLRPGDENFWVAQAAGEGRQELTWEPEDGDWTVVVTNTDRYDLVVEASGHGPAGRPLITTTEKELTDGLA